MQILYYKNVLVGGFMVILGIDPGLATVGYGVIEYDGNRITLLDYGTLETPAGLKLAERLDMLYDLMSELIDRFDPESIAFEELFFAKNVKTGIAVAHARGVLVAAAYKKVKRIFEYTPLQVKQSIVGYGRAEKKQVMEMTKVFLHLDRVAKPDDAADALALAICHGNSSQSKLYGLRTIKDSKKTGGQ